MRSPRGQAKAITRDGFAVILARAGERAQVDRAIAGVLFHAGLRRSEAAELRWGDVEPAASIPGALTIRVRTSKTNRDGEATDVRLAKNGAAAAPGWACQRIDRGRSQHHRDDASGRLEDCPHGGALQRRGECRARRGCQVLVRVHPLTRPRLGFDAIEDRRDFRGVIGRRVRGSLSSGDGPRAA